MTKRRTLPADGGSYTRTDGGLKRTQAPTAPAPGKSAAKRFAARPAQPAETTKRTNKETL
jgi:hypothetical protein